MPSGAMYSDTAEIDQWAWIGLTGPSPLVWDSGLPYSYDGMSSGGDDNGKAYWRIIGYQNWGWNDTGGVSELNPFICEFRVNATSCMDILTANPEAEDGLYFVDPEGNGEAVEVYCDMTTDSGGWTRVLGLTYGVLPNPSDLVSGLEAAGLQTGSVSPSALNGYMSAIGASELRFECTKPSHGRTIDIVTSDASVVNYFTSTASIRPAASGTYTTLPADNSLLSAIPGEWDEQSWSHEYFTISVSNAWYDQEYRLCNHVLFKPNNYHFNAGVPDNRWECDDFTNTGDGEWSVWIR